jgi:hypothetical protein
VSYVLRMSYGSQAAMTPAALDFTAHHTRTCFIAAHVITTTDPAIAERITRLLNEHGLADAGDLEAT